MIMRRQRAQQAVDAVSEAGPDDDAVEGIFGLLRLTIGHALSATKRAPQPIRRILWGERPPR